MNKSNLISFINKKLEEAIGDSNLSTKEYNTIKNTYLTIINFIDEHENVPSCESTYEVDYSCPDRNSFIETVERSL